MLQCCVCLSVVCLTYVLWINGAYRAKVTIDSLFEVVYEVYDESIGTKMNDLDLYLEIV